MIEITIPVLIAFNIGLNEVIKRLGLETRFIPLTAVLIGCLLAFLSNLTASYELTILQGLLIGLSSAGLFDLGRKTILDR